MKTYVIRHIEDPADTVEAVIPQTEDAKTAWLATKRTEVGHDDTIDSYLEGFVFIPVTFPTKVTFIRWYGQDGACMGLGDALTVYRKAQDPTATAKDLDALATDHQLSYVEADLEPTDIVYLGHMV